MKIRLLLVIAVLMMGFSSKAQLLLANLNVGDVAPDFTLTDLEGNIHKKADYAGEYLLIDMFYTACGPCQGVSPIINEFYKKYGCNGYGINVLAVETSVNNSGTQQYETMFGGDPNYPTPTCSGIEGGGEVFQAAYQPIAFPAIIIIGSDGLIKSEMVWPVQTITDLENHMMWVGATLVERDCSLTGLFENQKIALELQNNPVSEFVSLRLNESIIGKTSVKIYGVGGWLLKEELVDVVSESDKVEINLNELNAGTYFLQLSNGTKISEMINFVKL